MVIVKTVHGTDIDSPFTGCIQVYRVRTVIRVCNMIHSSDQSYT